MIPEYTDLVDKFKQKGAQEVIGMAVNDPFVMIKQAETS